VPESGQKAAQKSKSAQYLGQNEVYLGLKVALNRLISLGWKETGGGGGGTPDDFRRSIGQLRVAISIVRQPTQLICKTKADFFVESQV
jgi:hypothetical protein